MNGRNAQFAVSLFDEEHAVETALGESNPHADAASWNRDSIQLGQVATPEPVAKLMAQWVMSSNPTQVLDPAAGLGSLLHECHRLDPSASLMGIERDANTLRGAMIAAPSGTKLMLGDYLFSSIGRFNGIIANPPYVKAHRLKYPESVWRAFEESFGTPLDRLTNLYALFLLKIWEDLAPDGRAAVLLPAEFLNANFGEEIKQHLIHVMRPVGISVFSSSLNLFDDALTTSAIVFLQKGRPSSAPSSLVKVDSIAEAEAFLRGLLSRATNFEPSIDISTLDPLAKWLNMLFNGTSSAKPLFPHRIGDYFHCRRGIATGGNNYFCLSLSEIRQHGLKLEHFDQCITKAIDAAGLIFLAQDFDSLISSDRKCYLLNPHNPDAAMSRYLELGKQQEIHQRHLPSHRPVWYLPENRQAASIWVAVFSRENVKFILNQSGAKNLTCFHGLYPKPGHENLAPLVTLYLNSSWGRRAFAEVNRFYGDGLNKLEPKDVEALPCPELIAIEDEKRLKLLEQLREIQILPIIDRAKAIDQLAMHHVCGLRDEMFRQK